MIDFFSASHSLWAQVGLTLTHFLWQGALIALVLAAALGVLRHRTASARYVACTLAMLLMGLSPAATWCYVRTHPRPAFTSLDHRIAPLAVTHQPPGRVVAPARPPVGGVAADDAGATDVSDNEAEVLAPDLDAALIAAPELPQAHWPGEATATTPARETGINYPWLAAELSLAAQIWLFCVVLLGSRLMVGWLALRRLRSHGTQPLPDAIRAVVLRITHRLGLRHPVDVLATEAIAEPVAFGLLRPVVLVPLSVLTQCPIDLVEAMIAHELAHVRRHDLWLNLLQRVLETLLFYHPAVWWVSGRMRLERELCCDDLAVGCTARRADYAEALVALSLAKARGLARAWAAGMFTDRLTLLARVRRVLQLSSPPQQSRFWLAGPLCLLLAGSLMLVTRIHAADTPPATPATLSDQAPATAPAAESAEAVVPSSPPPKTSMIQTDFSPFADEFAVYRQQIDQQRAVLDPAVQVIQAFHAFRQALVQADQPALARHFRPEGKPAAPRDIEQLVSDLKTLGLDQYKEAWSEPWIVETVIIPAGGKMAQLHCRSFSLTLPVYHRSQVRMGLWCRLAADESGQWTATSLAVLPSDDEPAGRGPTRPVSSLGVRGTGGPAPGGGGRPRIGSTGGARSALGRVPEFAAEAIKRVGDGHSVLIHDISFGLDGRPSDFATYRVTLDPSAAASDRVDASQLEWESTLGGRVTFDDTLRQRQCFPAAPAPTPVSGAPMAPRRSQSSEQGASRRSLDDGHERKEKLDALEQDRKALTERLAPAHPQVQALDKQLADLRRAASREQETAADQHKIGPGDAAYSAQLEETLAGAVRKLEETRKVLIDQGLGPAHRATRDIDSQLAVMRRQLSLMRSGLIDRPDLRVPIPVRSRADGIVAEVKVKEGQAVKKGDLLIQLDNDEIKLQSEEAEVELANAQAECEHMRQAVKQGAGGASELHQAESALRLAEIELRRNRLLLDRTRIESPADGVVQGPSHGIPPVWHTAQLVGQKVSAGDELLTIETNPDQAKDAPPTDPKPEPAAGR